MDATDIRILSAGSALPGPPVDNATLARRFGMDQLFQQWIDTFIGTGTRHLAVDLDSGEVTATLVDLGERAARLAIERAGLTTPDIDVLVFASATPDALLPTTVNLVADRLGINDVPTYQVQSGCSGAYQAIDLGRQLLLTPGRRHALVMGGDVLVKHFDLSMDVSRLAPPELVNMLLFGDGAGAAVLTRDRWPGTTAIRHVLNRVTGLGRAPGQTVEWFGLTDRHDDRPAASEDYKAIEEHVPKMAREIVNDLLAALRWTEDEVDYLLPPQLSGQMSDRVTKELGIPGAEEIVCVRETANTGNAVPFIQLERLLPELVTGDRTLGVTVESSKWIKAGFALERV
ncbi:3-oxoacyl-ACP synthase III family protein [Streptomyces mayteni]